MISRIVKQSSRIPGISGALSLHVFQSGYICLPSQQLRMRQFSSKDLNEKVIPQAADANKDGVITPQEVFDMIDTNKDNVLSREEFMLACDRMEVSDLVHLRQSLARSELSRTQQPDQAQDTTKQSIGGLWVKRLITTLEVVVSKIFPAGFGWQSASVLAGNAGLEPTSMGFFLATGLGDFTGVFLGHSLYMVGKKAITQDKSIEIGKREVPTALLLGSAAFCSGSVWQPLVNLFQGAEVAFNPTLALTTVGCGAAFFGGLRMGRLVYGRMFPGGVDKASYANLKADAALSLAIGGATGAFVGTDVTYADANWLRPVVGIEDTVGDLAGAVLAGSSTSLGFTAFQVVQNSVVPAGKNWVD